MYRSRIEDHSYADSVIEKLAYHNGEIIAHCNDCFSNKCEMHFAGVVSFELHMTESTTIFSHSLSKVGTNRRLLFSRGDDNPVFEIVYDSGYVLGGFE